MTRAGSHVNDTMDSCLSKVPEVILLFIIGCTLLFKHKAARRSH